jgi:hypothetical protein
MHARRHPAKTDCIHADGALVQRARQYTAWYDKARSRLAEIQALDQVFTGV